jgi:uncharacterized protein YheU (UPF0270 family)
MAQWGDLSWRKRTNPPVNTDPPAGFYDPALDAQQRAGNRGLSQFGEDTALADSRASSDYILGQQQLQTQSGRSLQDLLREHTRFGEDTSKSTTREGQDYGSQIENLQRSFQRLGQSQAQAATSRGLGGGALRAAMKARESNQAIQRKPLDTAHTRFGEDVSQATAREGADYGTNTARVNEDLSTGLGSLGLDYGRGVADRSTALSRAGLENVAFGQDIGAQKLYQAGQANWVIPKRRY